MKRFAVLLLTLLIAVPLTLGILAGVSFYSTGEENLPSPTITLLDKTLEPTGYDWQEPVFGGTMHRRFLLEPPERAPFAGQLEQPSIEVETPAGYTSTATVYFEGQQMWTGRAASLPDYLFLENGRYELRVECAQPESDKRGHGKFIFTAGLTALVEPEIEMMENRVSQGDVLAVQLTNLPPDTGATLECGIGIFPFTQGIQGSMTAYVPIAWNRAAGEYIMVIKAGGQRWEESFYVTTETPSGSVNNTAGEPDPESVSEEAYAEFEDTIPPLYGVTGSERYWQGRFEMPVENGVTTGEYSSMLYVDLRTTGQRSEGIDIAAVTGSKVMAANNGQVIFAGYLLNTGNTVVINHGGGLKTYYYYMDELSIEAGDTVQTGQQIGTVGSTGSATGAHLHFQVRIGAETISPSLLLNGSGGLYAFG